MNIEQINPLEIGRVTRSKQEAQAAYDKISRWYDLLEGIWEQKIRETGLRKLAVQPGESVLEIGFATGDSILSLARQVGQDGKVIGIDLSPRMREITQERVAAAGLARQVKLICGDALRLPLENGTLDAIFTSFTLELFDTPEIPQVLRECRRALRDGGRLGVVSLSRNSSRNMMIRIYEWLHRRFPHVIDCRPIYARQMIASEGFRIVEFVQTSICGLPVEIVMAEKR